MRIISGFAKGLRLYSPHGQTIRPTSDKAREALFNIIGSHVPDASVLDLFAGTGAIGLEAFSRGAAHITFVDKSQEALLLIRKNVHLFEKIEKSLQTSDKLRPVLSSISIIKEDLGRRRFSGFLQRSFAKSIFDLIFLDPPYSKGLCLQTLIALDNSSILTEHGLIIAEEHSGIELPDRFNTLTVEDKRRYGDTGFWFYRMR